MTKQYKVVILNQDDEGNYWTEVIRSYDDYDQASTAAAEFYGSIEEVEEAPQQ